MFQLRDAVCIEDKVDELSRNCLFKTAGAGTENEGSRPVACHSRLKYPPYYELAPGAVQWMSIDVEWTTAEVHGFHKSGQGSRGSKKG